MISIIICVKNGAEYLGKCLNSIEKQTCRDYELIVIDNRSTDNSVEICRNKGILPISFEGSLSDCRNFGADRARGEYIFHVDCDQILSKNLLQNCLDIIESNNKECLVVSERSVFDNRKARLLSFERKITEDAKRGTPRFFKKEEYLKFGGHSKGQLFGEDASLLLKIDEKDIGITSEFIYHHDILSFRGIFKKYVAYGRTIHKLENQNKIASQHFNGIILSLARNCMQHPFLCLGVAYLKFVKVTALFYGNITRQ